MVRYTASGHVCVASLLLLATAAYVEAAKQKQICSADPLADPKNDPCNPLRYIPSNTLTAIALSKFQVFGFGFGNKIYALETIHTHSYLIKVTICLWASFMS